MNRVWTEEELEILRRDRAAKVPVPVTAAKLGRPVPATYARARLIGTLVQPHQSWDEDSVARLRALVSADPPMTDKRIAEQLGRTVTQIRWKMQDLGLIGVRDLSKLAKITASETARPRTIRSVSDKPAPQRVVPAKPAPDPAPVATPARPVMPVQLDPRAALDRALKKLEDILAERLKAAVSASESGMIQAAKDAIAEKGRIDRRLAELGKKAAQVQHAAKARRVAEEAEARRKAEEIARRAREQKQEKPAVQAKPVLEKTVREKPQASAPKPVVKKMVAPAAQGIAQAAAPRPAPQSAPPPVPKIVVTEAPAAPRPVADATDATPAQMSGRGGWKSVRRDPARIAAQAKAKATNRADAVDLAQAAQAAIERFIAERGVTRTETNGVQALVSRLQARGYIVVREEKGWVIDQRHRVDDEAALIAFAEARGITMDIAA